MTRSSSPRSFVPFVTLFGVCIVLTVFLSANGEPTPQAMEVLSKANDAAQQLKAIAYEAQYFAEGDLAGKMPKFSGKVLAVRGETGQRHRVFVQGGVLMPGQTEAIDFRFATDGENAFKIEEQRKLFIEGKMADARVSEMDALFPPKYFGDVFRNEMSSSTATHEGVETIDGVECDIIKIVFDPEGNRTSRYFFGKNDSLLHRAENTIKMRMPGATSAALGRIIFNAKGVDTKPKFDAGVFRLPQPDGFRKEVFQGSFTNAPQTSSGFLAAGSAAPDWELKTSDGKTMSLKSLRGRVVVMDFWSSWCGPCKMAMPGLQKVHEHFKDKPVTILGVNCRERKPTGEADGLEFVRQKGLTYTQLVKADSVADAYKIQGLPSFYIIDPDGKVVYATSGFQPNLHQFMAQLIEKNLPQKPATETIKEGVPVAP